MNITELTEKPKVAFIDDEKRILRSMKLIFRKSHDVFITTDPDEYLDYIKNNEVHVAVSDQRMPARLGVDILNDVKAISPKTMRILLTGYADLEAIIGSINNGEIYRYLTKPCKSQEIQKVVYKATQIAMSEMAEPDQPITTAATTAAMAQRAQHSQAGMTMNQIQTNRDTLLIIDENIDTIQKIRAQFSNTYEILYADNLEAAYDYLANNKIGVCITDIHLKGENIAPIIYTLKQDAPHLVVVVQTQFQDAGLLIDLINKGQVYRCLPKPIRASLLEISISRAFQQHQKLKASEHFVKRFDVEVEEEDTQSSNVSSKVKSFISRLRGRFSG